MYFGNYGFKGEAVWNIMIQLNLTGKMIAMFF